jgi:hypothetical protein
MPDRIDRNKKRPPERPGRPLAPRGKGDAPVEQDPAVERGERIDTGKTIHRGGKTTGYVPGATEQKP